MRRCWLLLLVLPAVAGADERILNFDSTIRVMRDGWIEVTEEITVRAEGNRIRRGIYRDIPLEYFDRFNNRYEVRIEPLLVRRNDASEAFHVVESNRHIRVYFGRSDRYIDRGVHRYVFRYRANRMLGFFDDHDELYWNVTGFDWEFPIDAASARVEFDFDVDASAVTHEAYTGPLGARGRDYTSRLEHDGSAEFESNSPLSSLNGLTIVVGWPKGHVTEPTAWQRAVWMVSDNRNLLVAFAGLVLLFAYYVPVWRKHGRDPEPGPVVTRYEPPAGFSPASLRYIHQMYYDDTVMAAAIVNLAVKGYVEILNDDDEHTLVRRDPGADAPPLAPGEQELYEVLFLKSPTMRLHHDNHMVLGSAKSAHRQSLRQDYNQHYFRWNGWLNLPGIAIVLLTTLVALNIGRGPTFPVIATIVVMFLTMAVFAIIMKRPTMRGRKLLDEMTGFQDYLEDAEKYEMNLRNPPEKTPQLFETYLPYALALGVEQRWAEKFAAILGSIRNPDGSPYRPAWYYGDFSVGNLGTTTSNMASGLSSALTQSVSPPGSSSGGGGGGFSGGGGGGGGGGGW